MQRELLSQYSALASEQPDQLALVFERGEHRGRRLSWGQLWERGESLCQQMRANGVHQGGRCAVILADHPDTVPTLLALWQLDATAVLIDGTWGTTRIENVLRHSGATHVVTLQRGTSPERFDAREAADVPPLPDGTAMLAYTSGSSGDPKGVPITHAKAALTLQTAAAAVAQMRGSAVKRIAAGMRLSASGVLNLHYTWAAFSSATLVVLPELTFASVKNFWAQLQEHQADQLFLVPPLIELLNHGADATGHRRESLTCLTGSAPLSAKTQERFQEKFGLPLHNIYGLSESVCVAFFGASSLPQPSNNIGHPRVLHCRLKNADGKLVETEGELELCGPTIFTGYYRNPQATAAAFDGRWFRTGDIARRDDAGRYFIVGRTKEAVMKGGFSVYLNEVDEAAENVEGVAEAAAVRCMLPNGGEDVGLIVRLAPGVKLSQLDLLSKLRADLGPQRAPYRVLEVSENLPRAAQHKLDRTALGRIWDAAASAL